LAASTLATYAPRIVLHGQDRGVYAGDIDIVSGSTTNSLIKLQAAGNIELHGNKIVLNSTTHIAVDLPTNSADVASGELWRSNGVVRVKP
jgi:hypothetical protein